MYFNPYVTRREAVPLGYNDRHDAKKSDPAGPYRLYYDWQRSPHCLPKHVCDQNSGCASHG